MTRSIYDAMGNVRLRLGNPRAGVPDDFLLLQQISSHLRTVMRHKQNTGIPWNYNDTPIDVQEGESTYLIQQTDFGTPLVVLTRDDANPQHIVRIIPVYMSQNIYHNYGLPGNIGGYVYNVDGSLHSALRCNVFWKANLAYIEFVPPPMLACTYVLRYIQNVASVGTASLDTSPIQDEDWDVVETRSARSLLANTEWMAPDNANGRSYNAEKRKDLMVTLAYDEALAVRQFEAAQLVTTGGRVHNRWTTADI